jgi:hypothetical protein
MGNDIVIQKLKEIGQETGVPVIVRNYDHCQSLEELEFDVYCNPMQEGRSDQEATRLAKEMARDLWK